MNPKEVHPDLDDDDVEPEEHDPSYFAAAVRAGGPPWDPASSVERRRAFWEWWLAEAVPAAAHA